MSEYVNTVEQCRALILKKNLRSNLRLAVLIPVVLRKGKACISTNLGANKR